MSLFNLPVTHKAKPVAPHPWERTVRDIFSNKIKHVHNSLDNPHYSIRKGKVPNKNRVKFTVIGNRVTKEFIYCAELVRRLHQYRWKLFDAPTIRGVTGVEWPLVWNELKLQHGGLAFCILGQVAVLYNGQFLGGDEQLAKLVANKYCYHFNLNYHKESVAQFLRFVKSSARPCVWLQITIDGNYVGTMIFMLYGDMLPNTCENFMRLCRATRGGYSGTPVHRVVGGGWVQGGGFGLRAAAQPCEGFLVPHDRRGVLAMANDGRDVDCSTQFFVLLEPMPWMQHKYVAFGQLIDGDSVLRQIESVPTWYEAPTSKIVIQRAGVLNLDCQDIKINPRANEYVQGHVEDLILMEQVYLEVEFRRNQRLEPPAHEGGEAGEGGEEEQKERDMRAAQRFIRKKEEMQKQLEKAIADTMDSRRSSAGGSRRAGSPRSRPPTGHHWDENDQFDVETYTYEPEESPAHPASAAPSPPPPRETPFYIPLTDVPYPGEVDSHYDLKKFIKGDYCLESDLTQEPVKMVKKKSPGCKSSELQLPCDPWAACDATDIDR